MLFKYLSLTLIIFVIFIITWGILKIHTYPEKIAKSRSHPQTRAIAVTALLGLLVFPLWMFALVWAYSNAVFGRLYNEGDKPSEELFKMPKSRKEKKEMAAKAAAEKKEENKKNND